MASNERPQEALNFQLKAEFQSDSIDDELENPVYEKWNLNHDMSR